MLMLPALIPARTASESPPFPFNPLPPVAAFARSLFLSSPLPNWTRAFFAGGSSDISTRFDVMVNDVIHKLPRCALNREQHESTNHIAVNRSRTEKEERMAEERGYGKFCVFLSRSFGAIASISEFMAYR